MNKKKNIAILFIVLCVLLTLAVEKFYFNNQPISFDRVIVFMAIGIFIDINYYFDRKKVWNFIFNKRYFIATIVLLFIVINGYHGSSVSIYNWAIQDSVPVDNGNPILGESRTIRSDEWGVSTPLTLSQGSEINDFGIVNHSIMAKDSPVILYPKYPVKDISILSTPTQIPYLVLPIENAFSTSWNLGYFILFFATFEFLRILTADKRSVSLIGAIFVTLAPAVQWWEAWNILAYGEIAMILFYRFIHSQTFGKKVIYSILIGWIGSCYIMTLYPAWIVPYAYFFLMIVIWLIISNKDKIKVRDFIILIPIALIVMVVIMASAFIQGAEVYNLVTNTVYPGARLSTGGSGWQNMFNMFTNLATPYKMAVNQSEMSQFLSFYPIPMIVGLAICIKNYKNNKNDVLLNLLLLVSLFLSIWNFVELPEIFVKITLLSMSTVDRSNIVLGYINCIILLLCISKYQLENVNKKQLVLRMGLGLIYVVFGIYIAHSLNPEYMSWKVMVITGVCLYPIIGLFLVGNKRYQNFLLAGILGISIISGLTVHPWNKGLNTIYEKPIAKEVQKIMQRDQNAIFMVTSSPYYYSNLLCANGARTINATNFYPNFDFWEKLDLDKKQEKIYNRYAHLVINITEDKTNYNLMTEDLIELNLNTKDLSKYDVDYIVSCLPLSQYSDETITFQEMYYQDGIYLYSLVN